LRLEVFRFFFKTKLRRAFTFGSKNARITVIGVERMFSQKGLAVFTLSAVQALALQN
jgi:hypothetical protein